MLLALGLLNGILQRGPIGRPEAVAQLDAKKQHNKEGTLAKTRINETRFQTI